MKIKLQNKYLPTLIPFLNGLKLRGEKSRARSKFLALASNACLSFHESELALLQEYAVLDNDGNPLTDKDCGFTIRDGFMKEYLSEREKLFNEIAEIEGGTYTSHLELMREILADYDEVLDGENAALYDALWDSFIAKQEP